MTGSKRSLSPHFSADLCWHPDDRRTNDTADANPSECPNEHHRPTSQAARARRSNTVLPVRGDRRRQGPGMKAMAGVDMPPQLPTVVSGADGVIRCRWATETGRDLTAYHDHEWGTPTHDEAMLFEALALTYFENGLSWASVFDKRDNLRAAFHGFNPAAVAVMTSDDVERLMADATIIRNRRKIEATLHN